MNRFSRKFAASISTLFFLLVVSACTVQRSPVTGNRRAYGYSWEQEKQLGAESDKQIQQQYGIYDNKSLQNYVENISQDVLANSDLRGEGVDKKYRETKFTFRVLDSPVINAFALPGGYVYVTRGLLGDLRNEAQLAVVVGHEIGHVAARHASQRAFEQQVGQLALIGGAVGGELLGVSGADILQLGSQAAQLMFLKYSRDDESESDKLGVEYAAKTHYDAAEGADFFTTLKRLSAQSGQSIPTWQSTHPDPSGREQRIPKLAEGWSKKGIEMNKVDADEYMEEIDNIVYGDNPRQGYTDNGVFYHPELAFKFPYPQGWQLVNTPSAVQMVNKDQNAIIVFQIDGKNDSPRASISEFINQKGVNGSGGSATSNNGINGFEASATGKTQNGDNVQFYLYAVEFDGNIYRFTSYTLADKFDQYLSQFKRTATEFDRLRDSNILNVKPVRLNISRASRTAKFQSFLPNDLPMDITPEDVAITNQVELNDTIEKGTWIKIPRQ